MNSAMRITTPEFAPLETINVFHRQLDKTPVPPSAYENRHILFRREFDTEATEGAVIYITADDYYKLWINGEFAGMGPAPSYTFRYNYNKIDISPYLKPGRNVIAVHTYYQGLINRVWTSGDNLHMFCCALDIGGRRVLESDKSWKYACHTGYSHLGTTGYKTQFRERYDAGAPEVGFEHPCFDDSGWSYAVEAAKSPHTLVEQETAMLTFETMRPASVRREGETVIFDLGQMVVGYPSFTIKGKKGDVAGIFCGQELNPDGSVRYKLRCNCEYAEEMVLSGCEDRLVQYDYKAFRYVELHLPPGARFNSDSFYVTARHYPFAETAKPFLDGYEGEERETLERIWKLCSDTLRYGVQEVIQDCPDREKGFYLGDGCYTALTHLALTGDPSICRKMIYDALASEFITPGLVTCLDCSFMQEIAEYPLMFIGFVWAYYRFTGDRELLFDVKQGLKNILEDYRARYEGENGLLSHLDRWCVVEWPAPYRDGYDVDIAEGKVCEAEHAAINAYYVFAVKIMNLICRETGEGDYRPFEPLREGFIAAFYDPESGLFRDSTVSEHKSFPASAFAYSFGLCPDEACEERIEAWLEERTVAKSNFFVTFPLLMRLMLKGRREDVCRQLLAPGAWRRLLDEGATVTFEGWGADCKWNTSLFHLTMSYGALFMSKEFWDSVR